MLENPNRTYEEFDGMKINRKKTMGKYKVRRRRY